MFWDSFFYGEGNRLFRILHGTEVEHFGSAVAFGFGKQEHFKNDFFLTDRQNGGFHTEADLPYTILETDNAFFGACEILVACDSAFRQIQRDVAELSGFLFFLLYNKGVQFFTVAVE